MNKTRVTMLCVALVLFCIARAFAGGNRAEHISSQCLVPDWSKSSGGFSPALSPDGKILLYLSRGRDDRRREWEEQVWVLPVQEAIGYNPKSNRYERRNTAAPWRLSVALPETKEDIRDYETDNSYLRNAQWSLDGKRVAFTYRGRLFCAEDFDLRRQTASVRMLADVKTISQAEAGRSFADGTANTRCALPIRRPRWSPDGRKIAFMRWTNFLGSADLCVLDVASNTETVPMRDLFTVNNESQCSELWSRDSKSLIHSHRTKDGSSVRVVSVDGSSSRELPSGAPLSWSPTADQLLTSFGGLQVGDANFEHRRYLAKPLSPRPKAACEAERLHRIRALVREQYLGRLTAAQIRRFENGSASAIELVWLCQYCELKAVANACGPIVKCELDNIGSRFDSANNLRITVAAIWKVVGALSPDIRRLYYNGVRRIYFRLDPTNTTAQDEMPAWSPDGKRIAFVRSDGTGARESQVIVMDVATGAWRSVFHEDGVDYAIWAADGKALVVQARRSVASQPGEDDSAPWVEIASYPEIWLVKLEQPKIPAELAAMGQQAAASDQNQNTLPPRGQPERVYVSPGKVGMQPGATRQFQVRALDSSGFEVPCSGNVVWKCDSRAGSISETGLFTACDASGGYPGAIGVSVGGSFAGWADVTILPSVPTGGYVLERTVGAAPFGYLSRPEGVAVDKNGAVLVADTMNHRIQRYDSTGRWMGAWGSYGSASGQFVYPAALTTDSDGNLYVVDRDRVQEFDASGRFIKQFGSWQYRIAPGEFSSPSAVAVGPDGSVYITAVNPVAVHVFDRTGKFLRLIGSKGDGDGQFDFAAGVAVDGDGSVYVSSTMQKRVTKFDASGKFIKQWSSLIPSDQGHSLPDTLMLSPTGKALWVVDAGQRSIKEYDFGGNFIAVRWASSYGPNGPQDASEVAYDAGGNLYVADDSRHLIWKLDPAGRYIARWGSPGICGGNLRSPDAVRVGKNGNILVADTSNYTIQEFDSSLNFIKRWSEIAPPPDGLAIGPMGDIYMRASYAKWSRYDPSGKFVSEVGPDCTGQAMAIAPDGDMYVADPVNHRVLKLDALGRLLLKWGSEGGADGQFTYPEGIAIGPSGDVYVCDCNKHQIQQFDSTGKFIRRWESHARKIATDAQGRVYGILLDEPRVQIFSSEGKLLAEITADGMRPWDLTVDRDGSVYVVDPDNNTLYKFVPASGLR